MSECFYNLANAHSQSESYSDAVYNYQKALAIDPKNVAALYNLGNAYYI